MTDFWAQYVQRNKNSVDIDNPRVYLENLLREAEDDRKKLETQFNPMLSSRTDRENSSVVCQLENGLVAIQKLLEQHQQLRNQERKLTIEMKSHEDKARSIAQEFRVTVKRLNNTTRVIDYLQCLENFLKFSENLTKALTSESLSDALENYSSLANLTELVHDTPVEHLRLYSANLLVYQYEQLKVVLSSHLKKVLKAIEFPYVHKMPADHLIELFENHRNELKEILVYFFELRLPHGVVHIDVQARLRFIDWKPIPLFIQILLQDLIMRFNFHFYGKKETNDRRKPEWYLNEIIGWILAHDHLLKHQLQPLLDQLPESSTFNAKVEFIRGLIELVIVKLNSQITSILSESTLFTHYIEEILSFSQRLFEPDIDYPKHLPNCMNFLCDEIIFEKWFQVEQDAARMKLENIFRLTTAHDVIYQRLLEVHPDDIKMSQCTETFLTLINAMEDRYRLVRYPSCSLRLFSLQFDLIHDFLEELKFSLDADPNDFDPLSKRFCSILNSIVYVADVIQHWKTRPHYQHLQYFYDQYQIFAEKHRPTSKLDELSDRIEIDSMLADAFDSIQLTKEIEIVPVKILDRLLEQYRDEEEKHCNTTVNYIVKLLKSRSRRYLKEKWTTMPNPKDYVMMNISPSAADILLELQTIFSSLSMNLLKRVSDEIRARIIIEYDEFLFNCIVTDHSFNEGGAAQFMFDVTRGWSRISTDHIAQLFNKCRESALLLTMPKGSALLLRETLEQDTSLLSLSNLSSYDFQSSSPAPSALHEVGVHHLSEFEANQVLQHRLDLGQR